MLRLGRIMLGSIVFIRKRVAAECLYDLMMGNHAQIFAVLYPPLHATALING